MSDLNDLKREYKKLGEQLKEYNNEIDLKINILKRKRMLINNSNVSDEYKHRIKTDINKLNDEIKDIESKKNNIYSELKKKKINIDIFNASTNLSTDKIDLYKNGNNTNYIICTHDKKEIVGNIGYNLLEEGYNLYYMIYEKYRGNEYALHAVYLLAKQLYSINIKNIVIMTGNSNNASIRVMDKFKDLMGNCKITNNEYLSIYKYDISNIMDVDISKRNRKIL